MSSQLLIIGVNYLDFFFGQLFFRNQSNTTTENTSYPTFNILKVSLIWDRIVRWAWCTVYSLSVLSQFLNFFVSLVFSKIFFIFLFCILFDSDRKIAEIGNLLIIQTRDSSEREFVFTVVLHTECSVLIWMYMLFRVVTCDSFLIVPERVKKFKGQWWNERALNVQKKH